MSRRTSTHRAVRYAAVAPHAALRARGSIDGAMRVEDVASALAETMGLVSAITDEPGQERSAMNFLVTNGEVMVATRRHRTLFISDGRRREAHPTQLRQGERLDQLIIASEALCGNQTAWTEIPEEEVIGVDGGLFLHRWRLSDLAVVG